MLKNTRDLTAAVLNIKAAPGDVLSVYIIIIYQPSHDTNRSLVALDLR